MSPRQALAYLALVFAATLLLHSGLLRLPYFWDEAGYYIPAARDFFLHGQLIPTSTLTNAHPPLPAIYLAGGGSALPEVKEQLRSFPWVDKLPFGRSPGVNVLRPVDIRGIYDSTGLLLDQQDITPMGLAFHAIQQQSEDQAPLFGLMRKVLKAMKV